MTIENFINQSIMNGDYEVLSDNTVTIVYKDSFVNRAHRSSVYRFLEAAGFSVRSSRLETVFNKDDEISGTAILMDVYGLGFKIVHNDYTEPASKAE